jgi:hypothetical protein
MKTSKSLFTLASSFVFAVGCTAAQKTLTPLQAAQTAPPPQTVSVQLSGYTPPTGRTFSNIFVNNFSVKAMQGLLFYSTSRDGMPDSLKQAHASDYNFSITGGESAIPFFPDLMLYLAGITTASQSLLYCPQGGGSIPTQTLSSSNDIFSYTDTRTSPPTTQFLGLRDCDKLYIGLSNISTFDNDSDGIPDYLELRNGLNPKNPNDASLSITGDGVSNIEKIKRGIPVDENADSQPNQLFASVYKIDIQADNSRTFTVSNIPVLNAGQDNFIAIHLTELDNTTQKSYLYTAFYILQAGAVGQTFKFLFWGSPAQAALGMLPQNQGLTPQ